MASDIILRVPKDDSPDAPSALAPGYSYVSSRPQLTTNEGIPWRRVLGVLYGHWKTSLAFALAVELCVALVVYSLDYTYESRAVIEVEAPTSGGNVGSQNDGAPPPASADADYLGTQSEILKSDNLALGVIDELHLASNPIFLKQSWFEKLPGQVRGLIGSSQGKPGTDMERLVQTFKGRLNISEVKNSRLIEIGYESYDPQLSAQIVTTTVKRYLETVHRSKYEATLRAADSLAPELDAMKQAAEKANQALLDYQRTHDGVEFGSVMNSGGAPGASATTGNPISLRAVQLNQQLTEAMGERLQQDTLMQLINTGGGDSLPQMQVDPVVQQLTTRAADARAQLAEALSVYGTNNPQVRKLQTQIAEIDAQLAAQRERITSQVKAAHASAVHREELISKTLRDMKGTLDTANASVAHYDTLKREADATSNLYVALSSRIKEMAIAGSLNANNIRIVDDPRVPESPAGPHRIRMLVVGLLCGLVGGVGLAFVAEGMDDTISSVEDLRDYSKLPALALVPQVSEKANKSLMRARPSLPLSLPARPNRSRGLKVFNDTPRSPEAESIRNLATAIRLSAVSDHRRVQTVLITSSFPGEGKTTVAANLAIALARYGKTCLIDADCRHPAITSHFAISQRPGLQELLLNPSAAREICVPLPDAPDLVVIGVGTKRAEALEMLTSQRMCDLTEELRKSFDYIIFDSPPIIPFSDARWLSKLSDGAVLVARSSTTTRRAIMWSVDILEELNASLLGIVLNGVDLSLEYYSYGIDQSPRA
jgi:polysaccharide biosynthesis transport protein